MALENNCLIREQSKAKQMLIFMPVIKYRPIRGGGGWSRVTGNKMSKNVGFVVTGGNYENKILFIF